MHGFVTKSINLFLGNLRDVRLYTKTQTKIFIIVLENKRRERTTITIGTVNSVNSKVFMCVKKSHKCLCG